eukprot:CAMPEP_0195117188 /NCGR_PEP_ID=MMETSP0448-20130528/113807_1 /TAXON_ID=66468 /ORGANISM="Heterocapsa triquestra, Strain CCMP 448" /LENGTH=64 /DNA_ID=CAMNT_0040154399 /DNA_START=1 /DNA_END=192 /DNA_ORIENTATION=+
MNVVMPLQSSLFLMPRAASQVAKGSPQTFAWTVADVDTSQEYKFKLKAMKLTAVGAQQMQAYVN